MNPAQTNQNLPSQTAPVVTPVATSTPPNQGQPTTSQQPDAPTVPAPQIQSIVEPSSLPPRKSGIKKFITTAFFVFFVLLIVGGIYGAYAVAYEKIKLTNYPDIQKKIAEFVISLPFMPKTPKFLLAKSAYVHQSVTKESFDISLAIDSQDLVSSLGLSGMDLQAKGAIDYSDPKNIKLNLNASVTKDFNIELLKLDKFLYFKINKIPQLFLTALGLRPSDFDSLLNRWIAYDTSPLDTEARHSIEDKEVDPLSEQYIDQEFQKYLDEKVLTKLKVEEVTEDGFEMYLITLDADTELIDYMGKKLDDENKKKTGASLNVLGTSTAKLSDTVKSLTWKMYIDKKDFYTRKIVITSDIEVDSLSEESLYLGNASSIPQNSKAKIGFAAKFGDFGKEFDVKAPENPMSTEEFLNKVSEIVQNAYQSAFESMGSSVASSRDARRQADLQILRSGLELYRQDFDKYPNTLNELSPTYISQIPIDPIGTKYYYLRSSDQKSYDLCANLEVPVVNEKECPDSSYNYHLQNP